MNSTAVSKPTLNPVLRAFWERRADIKVLYGGRASSKSWDAAGMAIMLSQACKIKVLCTRQYQNKITDSVYSLLKIQIERFGLQDKFKILDSSITCIETGSEFVFYGLWRSIDEVKSMESIDILWIEEAHALTKEQWEVLEPTIRKEGSQVWIIFNPGFESDFVYQRFVRSPPKNAIIRKINYDENPFLSEKMLRVIEQAKEDDFDEYMHIYEGMPRGDSDESVIKQIWVNAAIDAHIKLKIEITGEKSAALDVADEGQDLNALSKRHGILLKSVTPWSGKGGDIFATTQKAFALCDEDEISVLKFDADGLGSGVRGDARVINEKRDHKSKIDVQPFRGSDGVLSPESEDVVGRKNKDFFQNRKAQSWWHLRKLFYNTFQAVRNGKQFNPDEVISLDSSMENLENLVMELCQPIAKPNTAGKMVVDKAPDDNGKKNKKAKSPNLADSVMINYAKTRRKSLGDYEDLNAWTQ